MAKPAKGYHELLGHFRRVRAYMQHFYVYGFYTRDEFEGGSARSYDNERRRVEGWMGEHYGFRMTKNGKANFIAFDSRSVRRNPLYRALKSKTFMPNDVMLHFLILDALCDGQEHGVQDIIRHCLQRVDLASAAYVYEENTLRKKLDDYEEMGVLTSRKQGRDRYFRMQPCRDVAPLAAALAFFSETAPCGVIGSYMEDRLEAPCEAFRMKHHYIAQTFDMEIMLELLEAMHAGQDVVIAHMSKDGRQENQRTVTPLHILRSVQDGRAYLLAVSRKNRSFVSSRLDRISAVKPVARSRTPEEATKELKALREAYAATAENRWGASMMGKTPQRISFTIRVSPWEQHVRRRMYRECRGGRVEELEGGLMRFTAELCDPAEILPWVRTFIGRITAFECENDFVTHRFRDDLAELGDYYGQPAEGEVQA